MINSTFLRKRLDNLEHEANPTARDFIIRAVDDEAAHIPDDFNPQTDSLIVYSVLYEDAEGNTSDGPNLFWRGKPFQSQTALEMNR